MVAYPWLVLQRTGNATDASAVAAAATLQVLELGTQRFSGFLTYNT